MHHPRSQATPLSTLQASSCASDTSANEEGAAHPQGLDLPPTGAAVDPQRGAIIKGDAPLPVFTSREEMIEFASQPAEEIVAAEADVLGVTEDIARVQIGDNISDALLLLEAELALIPIASKAAYIEATRRCPEEVDEEHKKAFLIREEYDAKLAAKRLSKYWEQRHALFGEEKCYLPLTLVGALGDDKKALEHCVLRDLPVKDEKERAIALWDFNNLLDINVCGKESMLRACWYTIHVASQDPNVQRSGFVFLFRPVQDPPAHLTELFILHAEVVRDFFAWEADCLPIVIRGVHWCKPNHRHHLVGPILKKMLGERLRGRLKVHYGTDEEVLESLEEYGMPRNRLPTELGGDVVIRHDLWLRDCLAEECWANVISIGAAAPQGIVNSSTPDLITENKLSSEQIDEETKFTALLDTHYANLISALKSDRGDSHLGELESASSVKRESDRQKHLSEVQCKNADQMLITKSSTALCSNDKADSNDIVSNDDVKKRKVAGCKGDPRMNKAVKEKLENPLLSAEDALRAGGFVFPEGTSPFMTDKDVLDTDNVSLEQRKGQLRRRLRIERKKTNGGTA